LPAIPVIPPCRGNRDEWPSTSTVCPPKKTTGPAGPGGRLRSALSAEQGVESIEIGLYGSMDLFHFRADQLEQTLHNGAAPLRNGDLQHANKGALLAVKLAGKNPSPPDAVRLSGEPKSLGIKAGLRFSNDTRVRKNRLIFGGLWLTISKSAVQTRGDCGRFGLFGPSFSSDSQIRSFSAKFGGPAKFVGGGTGGTGNRHGLHRAGGLHPRLGIFCSCRIAGACHELSGREERWIPTKKMAF